MSGVIAAIAVTLWGFSSDFLGRRKALVIAGVVSAILAIPAFYVWYLGAATNDVALLYLGAALAGWLTQWPWGLVPVYLSERFATQRRASGVGFGYSSGIFISAWMLLYSIPLYDLFKPIEDGNIWFVAAFWLILAGVVYGIAAFLGPETIGVDLRIAQEK
ncbi:MAG: MFS transporter [Thermoproteus sp.]